MTFEEISMQAMRPSACWGGVRRGSEKASPASDGRSRTRGMGPYGFS